MRTPTEGVNVTQTRCFTMVISTTVREGTTRHWEGHLLLSRDLRVKRDPIASPWLRLNEAIRPKLSALFRTTVESMSDREQAPQRNGYVRLGKGSHCEGSNLE